MLRKFFISKVRAGGFLSTNKAVPFSTLLLAVGSQSITKPQHHRSIEGNRKANFRTYRHPNSGRVRRRQISPVNNLIRQCFLLGKYEYYFTKYSPVKSDSLTKLLIGMAESTVVELQTSESGVRAIRLGNKTSFLEEDLPGSDTIYERDFYPRLVATILRFRRLILLSNPGTGKSVFQFYMLARYLNPTLFPSE